MRYLVEPLEKVVQISRDLPKLVPPKYLVYEFHLLHIAEKVPIIYCEVGGYLSGTFMLWKLSNGGRCLVLERGLRG